MKLKHSIGQLALVVLACGVAFRAIASPSALWAAVAFGLATAIGTLAPVGAACGRGRGRAACIGAATCGWAYLLAIYGPWTATEIGPRLPTNACIDLLYASIHRADPAESKEVALRRAERAMQMAKYRQLMTNAQLDPSPANEASLASYRAKIAELDDWILIAESLGERSDDAEPLGAVDDPQPGPFG